MVQNFEGGDLEISVPTHEKFLGWFIGRGGEGIATITRQCKLDIIIRAISDVNPPVIRIRAPESGEVEMERAARLVRARIAEFEEAHAELSLEVPTGAAFSSFFLGPNAAHLNQLEDELGVSVSLQAYAPDATVRTVLVRGGESARRAQAAERVRTKVAEFGARAVEGDGRASCSPACATSPPRAR